MISVIQIGFFQTVQLKLKDNKLTWQIYMVVIRINRIGIPIQMQATLFINDLYK